ncbi:unnamed protein product [Arabidopsis lyrata]|nr:unnamed protein product [Arabidopsis lyrata]
MRRRYINLYKKKLDFLRREQVEATLSVINVHFSPSIFEGIMSVIECLDTQDHGDRNAPIDPVPIFRFTVDTNLVLFRLHVNLENEGENSTVLVLSIQQLDLWYSLTKVEEWSVRVKTLEIKACSSKDADGHILCSSGNLLKSYSAYGQGMDAHNIRGLILSDAGILSDNVEMHASHKVSSFWHGVAFDAPETRHLHKICKET